MTVLPHLSGNGNGNGRHKVGEKIHDTALVVLVGLVGWLLWSVNAMQEQIAIINTTLSIRSLYSDAWRASMNSRMMDVEKATFGFSKGQE